MQQPRSSLAGIILHPRDKIHARLQDAPLKMSNKRNEDIEMRPGGADFGGERDAFLGRTNSHRARQDAAPNVGVLIDKIDHSPGASIIAYCLASISMTVVNKYVVSGSSWNMMFFYLAVQVCLMMGAGYTSSLSSYH